MGVAGQIFAARVAIGLAVPSPKALSQTGQMLGNFSSKMYKKLNSQHLEAAKDRSKITTQELQSANAKVSQFQKRSQSELMSSAQRSLNRSNKMFSGQVANSSRQVQQIKTSMGRIAPAMAPKLFANVTKDMQSGAKYQKMMKNFITLTQTERKSVLDGIKITMEDSKARAARAVIMAKENHDLAAHSAVIIEDAQNMENTYEQMMALDKDRIREKARIAQEERNLLKNQKEARDANNEALRDEKELLQEVEAAQEKLHAAMNKAVYLMKGAFGEVLRDSISILTGFYYKLSEVTSELVEFERELLNANSVFNLTRDELFKTSQTIVQFGQEFGLAMDNGAAGLYQLASAGLDANAAIAVLPHTLKLSMAVQGDHNTISKLTAQTLFGFGMEMDQAGLLTDKFAHAIQKSLIEYQDLTSAIKFALPFFTATGQSIDQLLGSLQVLTNRALEAGIAGRGLRQALAEFAEGAEENAISLGKMGVNILDANGEMLQLTEIAQNFADVIGPETASNTELLTTLIQELNVRGATAFIHLVQNAEEFKQAVEDTANAGGELDQMVRIQNESISAQMQILKNNVQAIFFMRDATDEATGSLNEFHQGVLDVIASLRGLIVEELADGSYALTTFGKDIQKIAIEGVQLFAEAMVSVVKIIRDFSKEGFFNISMLKAYFTPVKLVLDVIKMLGPNIIKLALWWKILNAIIPVSTLLSLKNTVAEIANTKAKAANLAVTTALGKSEKKRWMVRTKMSTKEWLGGGSFWGSGIPGKPESFTKTASSIKMLAKFIPSLKMLAIGFAAIGLVVAALVLKTRDLGAMFAGLKIGAMETFRMIKFAVTPLTELFKEWGDATERAMKSMGFSDDRAAMIGIMQEIGAVVALIVYAVSESIARILRFVAELGSKTLDIALGGDLKKLVDAIDYLQGRPKAMAESPRRMRDTLMGREGAYFGGSQGQRNLNSMASLTALGAMAGTAVLPGIGTAVGATAGFAVGTLGVIGGEISRRYANGGPIPAYANGGIIKGYANGGPIIVGERGPELFVPPRMGGQVLNSDRTRNLLRGQNGTSNGNGMINTLIVQNLTAANSTSNNSKIAVDTFAGVV